MDIKNLKFAIYIPAYNAAVTLPKVLDRIPASIKEQAAEIFVVDNNSEDHTGLVALGYRYKQQLKNLNVIVNPQNVGYGGSQKIAYRRCVEMGYDYVAMLHGDAQYAPEHLENLLRTVVENEADMVFGSRMTGDPLKGGMPLHRYLGNRALTRFQNRFLGTCLSEFHSGYRIYSVKALSQVNFERLSSDYHFDTEIIILFLKHGLKIVETPIPTHYGDEKNYVNIWKYGTDVAVTTITYYLHKKKWRRSKRWGAILDGAVTGESASSKGWK